MSKMAINSNQLIFVCDGGEDDVFSVGFARISGLTFDEGFWSGGCWSENLCLSPAGEIAILRLETSNFSVVFSQ